MYEKIKDPAYLVKLIGYHSLHRIYMGEGTGILKTKNGSYIVSIPSNVKKLPCGCDGQQKYIIDEVNDKLIPTHEHDLAGSQRVYIKYPEGFWDKYYEENPWAKPILINNLL